MSFWLSWKQKLISCFLKIFLQLTFYGFERSFTDSPAGKEVPREPMRCVEDEKIGVEGSESNEEDESSQDSGVGLDGAGPPSDETNSLDRWTTEGKRRSRSSSLQRSMSLPSGGSEVWERIEVFFPAFRLCCIPTSISLFDPIPPEMSN